MCMVDYADHPEFYSHSVRKAKKSHICDECGREILPGERYDYASGKADGEMWFAKTCIHCTAVSEWLRVVCGGVCHHAVYDDLKEHRDEEGYNPRWISIALSGMRKRWRRADGTMWRPMSLPKNLPVA